VLLTVLVGFAFGYLGSMPVAGPISVLVLHLGLAHDPRHALHVAVGGAVAEGLYALVAFWGLSTVLAAYPVILPASRLVGALLLLALGLVMVLRRVRGASPAEPPRPGRGRKRSLALGFLVTALNPTLIVTWSAAVGALHATGLVDMERKAALPFAGSVAVGIIAWFLTLLWLVAKWRTRMSLAAMTRFMKLMGAALVAAGAWMAVRAWPTLWRR
jgi:threonine/homoserine/homoserine lactone efflux protein